MRLPTFYQRPSQRIVRAGASASREILAGSLTRRVVLGVFLASASLDSASEVQSLPDGIVRAAARDITEARLRAHMAILADDAMEGRGTGTAGFDRAAAYVADQFKALQLEPLNGSYLQPLTIRQSRVDEGATTVTITSPRARRSLVYAKEFVTYGMRGGASTSVEGPLVYLGDGVSAPDRGLDSYRGLDVRGKIVLVQAGAPTAMNASERSFYGDSTHKIASAASRGAVGIVIIDAPQIPWELRVRAARQLGTSEAIPAKGSTAAIPMLYLNREAATEILGRALDGPDLQAGMQVGSARIAVRQSTRDLRSANVVARIAGSDPARRNEHVVVVAHLDHVGTGEPINGDSIYNGAVDNASGVSSLLTMASAFQSAMPRPPRSLIFLATTGEELGLIGAEYFVDRSDRVPGEIVAAINVDGTSVTPFEHIDVRGGSNSTLGVVARAAGHGLDIAVRLETIGVGGSDHSPFLRAGIPVLWVGATLPTGWMNTHYHTPQDDMRQPLDLNAAASYTRFVFLTTYLVADASSRPSWNAGEFFGQRR